MILSTSFALRCHAYRALTHPLHNSCKSLLLCRHLHVPFLCRHLQGLCKGTVQGPLAQPLHTRHDMYRHKQQFGTHMSLAYSSSHGPRTYVHTRGYDGADGAVSPQAPMEMPMQFPAAPMGADVYTYTSPLSAPSFAPYAAVLPPSAYASYRTARGPTPSPLRMVFESPHAPAVPLTAHVLSLLLSLVSCPFCCPSCCPLVLSLLLR